MKARPVPKRPKPEQSTHNLAREDRDFKKRMAAKSGHKKNQIYHPGA